MILSVLGLLAQLAAPVQQREVFLQFPEPGLDDTAAYRGYTTRLYRDAAENTVQVYLDRREARVVHVLADGDNASVGFTARDAGLEAVPLEWGDGGARVSRNGRTRSLEYDLVARAGELRLGWFVLGSMRVERDFQAWGRHRAAFGAPPFSLEEHDRLIAALARLPAGTRRAHLALLGASDVATLRARLQPRITTPALTEGSWTARVIQPSLDGRDTLVLELRGDAKRATAARTGRSLVLRATTGSAIPFTVRIITTADALTPLAREEIFTPEFLGFLAAARTEGERAASTTSPEALRWRWLERQVRGVELLSSREKLMAGLPTYATYFGRDMLVTALMMRPIWRHEMSAFVVASVLRKLSPSGQVSHEEALGGQAVREAAAEYASLVDGSLAARRRGARGAADSLVSRAADVLRDARRVRENYHMIDDEYQLPVLAGRWLTDARVDAATKRAFLLDSSDGGGTRLARLLRELALVARTAAPYVANPAASNLVAFAARDTARWAATSWRDSNAGYGNGRFAMDVNAIWVPHALEATGRILETLPELGLSIDSLLRVTPELAAGTPLGRYARDAGALRASVTTWRGASRHFLVRLSPAEVRAAVSARLAAMPAVERAWWERDMSSQRPDTDSLTFLALSLDANARPVAVANTDPSTRLFLGDSELATPPTDSATAAEVLRDVRLFVRPYPVGLYIDRVGAVVANDAYASPAVWRDFVRDPYHGPRVAWGREVNLFLLGVANRIEAAGSSGRLTVAARDAYVAELNDALRQVRSAVAASGFRSELWSYEFPDGRLTPVRYGSGGDVQLWSTTDLVVQFALSRLKPQ